MCIEISPHPSQAVGYQPLPTSEDHQDTSADRDLGQWTANGCTSNDTGSEASSEAVQARERLLVCCENLKQRLNGLLDSKGKVAQEIHAIRKLGKSLRGGFCLFRLGKSSALEIQVIGRLLSEPRDAVSRFNTWNKLGWTGDAMLAEAIGGLLEQQTHSAARRPPPETIAWCLSRVDKASAKLKALPAEELDARVAKGKSKLERKALSLCRKLDHREEEDFHEARKALKAWIGAVGYLEGNAVTIEPTLNELAEILGDENDVATLSVWLDQHGFTKHIAPDLWQHISQKRRCIQDEVIRNGKRLR